MRRTRTAQPSRNRIRTARPADARARAGGYHRVSVGDTFKDGRYKVLTKLGWGHFSTVWLCSDASSGAHVALKVQKSASHYTEAAWDEIEILRQARRGVARAPRADSPAQEAHAAAASASRCRCGRATRRATAAW